MSYVYLLSAVVLEVLATNSLKASESFTRLWPSMITAAGYTGAFYMLSLTLRGMSLAVAYAMWSGLGIVFTAAAVYVLFREKLDAPAVLGMGLIIAGVVVINLFSKTVGH